MSKSKTNAGDNRNVNKVYGPVAASATPKPFNIRLMSPNELVKDKYPTAKPESTTKPSIKKPLTGPDAVREYQRQVSAAGMKASQQNQMDAINKKYPGLYKKITKKQ